jgi:CDP-6-deoxy-D-xylo-4-hexulose-3-dehydrase
MHRIEYAGSVHGEDEIAAVVEVLRGPPTALRIGRNVRGFEQRIATLLGKQRGIMCNSGSSALYLAVEALALSPGDEVITSVLTFSTDVAPLVRAGLVPAFVDIDPDTYQIDVDAIERMISPRTKAILVPNLIGNAPDWDRIRAIADTHGLKVVEDSCDGLGLRLRGKPTGARADISVTSFALSHIITAAGTGGMVCVDDDELADRILMLRRWGRRSEVQLFGSAKGTEARYFSDVDGLEYDNLFIFDEVGWNFEPSELSAAFGLVQLTKLEANLDRRRRNFAMLREHFAGHADVFDLPRTTPGLVTAWHMFPFVIRPGSTIERSALQRHLESHGIDTRMVWTGNVLRQPAFKGIDHRADPAGYPHADRVMRQGLVLPCHHGMDDADVSYICQTLDVFLAAGV